MSDDPEPRKWMFLANFNPHTFSFDVTHTMDSTRLVSWSDGSYSVVVSALVDYNRLPRGYRVTGKSALVSVCSIRLNGTPFHSETIQTLVGTSHPLSSSSQATRQTRGTE